MNSIDAFLTRLALAAVPPLILFLTGWWGSIGHVPDNLVWMPALCGLAAGVLVDLIWFRKQIAKPYEVSWRILVFVFLFYSVCTLGFFMGVPVFNLLSGTVAGFYVGRRLRHAGAGHAEATQSINLVSKLSAAVMAMVCLGSAFIALQDPSETARNLQGMLAIRSFEVTTWMVVGLIAVGGPALIAVQYLLAKAAAERAYRHPE